MNNEPLVSDSYDDNDSLTESHKNQLEFKQEQHRKRIHAQPDANLYRGWALGLHHGALTFFLTMFVIFAQIVAPILMLCWGHQTMGTGKAQRIDIYIKAMLNESSTVEQVGYKKYPVTMALLMKTTALGMLLMIFINAELLLSKSYSQSDELRNLFKHELSKKWLWVDAFTNSWCIGFSALATLYLLMGSESIKDLILDAFGLLFLASLDEYGMVMEFGIEKSDFDAVVAQHRTQAPSTSALSVLPNQMHRFCRRRLSFGDLWYLLGRFVVVIAAAYSVPTLVLYEWIPSSEFDKKPWLSNVSLCLPMRDLVFNPATSVGAALILFGIYGHALYSYRCEMVSGNRQCGFVYFVYRVCFRGPPLE